MERGGGIEVVRGGSGGVNQEQRSHVVAVWLQYYVSDNIREIDREGEQSLEEEEAAVEGTRERDAMK